IRFMIYPTGNWNLCTEWQKLRCNWLAAVMESCGQPDLGHGGDHVMVLLDMQSFMGKHPGLLLVLCLKGCSWFRGRITDLAKRIFVYYLPPTTLGQINGVAYTGRETGAPDCSLHIRNLTLSDSGSYTVAKEGSVTAIGHVNIEIPAFLSRPPTEVLPKPSVSAFPGRFLIELTDSLHLKCNTTFKPMTISWFWNGGPLPSSSQFELSNHNRSLTTQRVNRSDMGDYQCQVSNPASTQRSDALKITVFYGPDPPEIQPAEKFYAEHSSFNLSCKATVFPEAEYRWFFNGKEEAKGPDLVIEDISLQQSGEYTCQAVNLVSHLESNTTLRIEVVPSKPFFGGLGIGGLVSRVLD
uniref:Ig-like domain-containing protein n=1 Tax=Varanus komodoensis TaxID=61221 RepID=A0A8D2J457_VARKO